MPESEPKPRLKELDFPNLRRSLGHETIKRILERIEDSKESEKLIQTLKQLEEVEGRLAKHKRDNVRREIQTRFFGTLREGTDEPI